MKRALKVSAFFNNRKRRVQISKYNLKDESLKRILKLLYAVKQKTSSLK